jgi:phage repressor protein C with HTH and peptisase S24 domain
MTRMATIKEIRKQEADRRRARLSELIRLHFEDRQKAFIDRTGINQGELSGLLKDKSFGGLKARALESAAGLLPGSLDAAEGAPFYAASYHNHVSIDTSNTRGAKRLTEERKVVRTGNLFPTEDLPQPSEEEFALVPQLDIAAACGNGRFEDHVVVKGGLAFKKSFLKEYGVPEHAARIIYASGGSMSPRIQDGRVVLINTAERNPIDGRIFAACLPDGGLILKRLVRDYHPMVGETVWILRSDNPDKVMFPDKILPPDDRTVIVGRAVWTDSIL